MLPTLNSKLVHCKPIIVCWIVKVNQGQPYTTFIIAIHVLHWITLRHPIVKLPVCCHQSRNVRVCYLNNRCIDDMAWHIRVKDLESIVESAL